MRSTRSTLWRGAAIAVLLLAMVVVRLLVSSRVELRDAEARLAAGDVAGGVEGLGRAARLYLPGSPFSSRGFERLAEMARTAEAASDRPAALSAWRELRSAILATRSIYTARRPLLDEANGRIAVLAAQLESPSVDPGADEAARILWHAARLAQSEEPSVGWSLVALAGFAAFVGAALLFFFRGLDTDDRLRGRTALACAIGLGLGFALFLLGIARA